MIQSNKKYPNFQDLYSFSDYKKAYDARRTFNCGLSPVCLLAPDQHSCVRTSVLKKKSHYASLNIRTLKLEYAIQVWLKAALISADNPGPLLYYWWLHYEDNDTSFREIQYSKNWWGATPESMIDGFWKLLEDIANSGEIRVCEGFSFSMRSGKYISEPSVKFDVVLDLENARNAYKLIDDVFTHPYDNTPKSYRWEEIKELYTQLTLKQLSLMDVEQLHKHSKIDEMLFTACDVLDLDGVKAAIKMGANVNALDKRGESALQHVVEYFNDHGIILDKEYTEEERQSIIDANYQKCVQIVDYLLELGADIDLFGVDGMQPLTCAYYAHSVEMVKHLLEKGANPNYNSYRCDDVCFHDEDSHRCTILQVIYDCLSDDYGDYEKEVETIIHDYGGRRLTWDYDTYRYEHIGKYYVTMSPSHETFLFFDNDGWGIGNEEELNIENEQGERKTIKLKEIPGLREWHQEYLQNIDGKDFDWNTWNKRGQELAKYVSEQLPDDVALFYPYGETVERKKNNWNNKFYFEGARPEIRIK